MIDFGEGPYECSNPYPDLSNLIFLVSVITSALLILFLLGAIVKVLIGSKFTFLIIMISLLLYSNVAFLVYIILQQVCWNQTYVERNIEIAMWFTITTSDGTFNLMHWLFCFKYWVVSVEIPKLLNGNSVSKNQNENRYKAILYLVAFGNVISVLWLNFSDFSYDGNASIYNQISYFSVYGFELLSAMFLLAALFKIRKVVNKLVGMELNEMTMSLHLCSFLLYVVSAIVKVIFSARANWQNND